MCILCVDEVQHTSRFATLALHRLRQGFRSAIWAQYHRMFSQIIVFLETENLTLLKVNTVTLLSFMEFCYQSGLSQANISIHMLAIRAMFTVCGLNTAPSKDQRLPLYIKSLKINTNFTPKFWKLISTEILQQIVEICSKLPDPVVYKAL